jgi:hypothetical protein
MFSFLCLLCFLWLILREAQQQVAVIRVLLLPQLDLTRQTLADRVGESVELVKDGDDAGLLGVGWDGDFKLP